MVQSNHLAIHDEDELMAAMFEGELNTYRRWLAHKEHGETMIHDARTEMRHIRRRVRARIRKQQGDGK